MALHLFNNGLSNDIVGIILKEVLEIVGTSLLYMKIYSMVGAIILRINPFYISCLLIDGLDKLNHHNEWKLYEIFIKIHIETNDILLEYDFH